MINSKKNLKLSLTFEPHFARPVVKTESFVLLEVKENFFIFFKTFFGRGKLIKIKH